MAKSLGIGTILKGLSHDYRIVRVLGSGTFGITYMADVILHNESASNTSVKVTIKEFFMKDFNGRDGSSVTSGSEDGYFGKYLEKFIREADKLSMITSSGVVKVLERFQANNTAYYVMQYLPGGSLNDIISTKGCIPESIALQLALQIAYALRDLHEKKMLHLDLKPSNIMLSRTHEAILIDFGLSKLYTDNGEPESSTSVGSGTRGYAPIEQVQCRDVHDFPVTMDIYALGATLFKMLVGIVPPDSSSILNDGFPEQLFTKSGISIAMKDFVKRLMSPMKKSRPQNMSEVISEIQSIGARLHIAKKSEVSAWITNGFYFKDSDEDTDVEIIAVVGGTREKFGDETEKEIPTAHNFFEIPTIDKIELKLITDKTRPHTYLWFVLTATPKSLTVVKQEKGEKFPLKKTYFYTQEKFNNLVAKIKACGIKSIELDTSNNKSDHGIGLKAYDKGNIVFKAASFDDESRLCIEGELSKLTSLAWQEAGLVGLEYLTSDNLSLLSRLINFVISPKKWIGHLAIISIVIFSYVLCNPIDEYINKNYKKDIVYSWEDEGYNHYTLLEDGNRTILLFKNEPIKELPYSDYTEISKVYKEIYEICCRSDSAGYLYAIYDNKGNVILPFDGKSKMVIADNVIKVYDYGTYKYYDKQGREISSLNFVKLYDMYPLLMNFCLIIIISIISCMIASVLYKLYIRRKHKSPLTT